MSLNFRVLSPHNNYIVILLTIFTAFCSDQISYCQSDVNSNEFCSDPNIQTILLFKSGNEMSFPILKYKENETLELRFDYLDENSSNYSYSFTNCYYDWTINTISEQLYIDGFNNYQIEDFRSSINTTRPYTNYSSTLPNEETNILSSGNYLLKVYRNGEPDKPVFAKRFCIAENLVDINTKINLPDETTQELQIEINLKSLQLINPLVEIKVVVIKNYDWNNQVKIKSAPLLRDNTMYFDMPYQVASPGGNEFRMLNTKSTRYEAERTGYIEFQPPYYHFFLKPDKLKQFTPYFNSEDFNGHFYVEIPKAGNRHEEADYVYVHFTLESPQPIGTDIYIYGALTGYRTDESNYMLYNPEKGVYEKTLLLKQGIHSYAYVTKDFDKKDINFDITEGNHSETENDYIILVYLRKVDNEIDKLIGHKIINTRIQ